MICRKASQKSNLQLVKEIPDAKHIALLCLMASLSLIAVVGLRVAALFISPVMVSMIRTFEIVMSLALEIITQSMGVKLPNQEFLNFTSETFMFKVAGCAIVTLRYGHLHALFSDALNFFT